MKNVVVSIREWTSCGMLHQICNFGQIVRHSVIKPIRQWVDHDYTIHCKVTVRQRFFFPFLLSGEVVLPKSSLYTRVKAG